MAYRFVLLGLNGVMFSCPGFMTSCSWDYFSRSAMNRSYYIMLFSLGFILPLVIIIIAYTSIIRQASLTSCLSDTRIPVQFLSPRCAGVSSRTCRAEGACYPADSVFSGTNGLRDSHEAAIQSSQRENYNEYYFSLKHHVLGQGQAKGQRHAFQIIVRRDRTISSNLPKLSLTLAHRVKYSQGTQGNHSTG